MVAFYRFEEHAYHQLNNKGNASGLPWCGNYLRFQDFASCAIFFLPSTRMHGTLASLCNLSTPNLIINEFRRGGFCHDKTIPYFLGYLILETVWYLYPSRSVTNWDRLENVSYVIIFISGLFYLRLQNRNSFDGDFIYKFFSLGWIISVRLALIAFPATTLLYSFTAATIGKDRIVPAGTFFSVLYDIVFFVWLGRLIAVTNKPNSEQTE